MEIISNSYLSTSAGYAILSYRTAYLKANYFLEYATAVLRSVQGEKTKLTPYANIVKSKGVDILFPCVNKSSLNMDIYDFDKKVISTGLLAVNGLPEETAKHIIEEREKNGLFESYEDFLERMLEFGLDNRGMKALAFSGALDCFDKNYSRLLSYYDHYSNYYRRVKEVKQGTQRSIFDLEPFNDVIRYLEYIPDNNGYDLKERLSKLCEYNNVGIHREVTDSYKGIRNDLVPNKWQNDDDFETKKGVLTGVLEDEFKISKKGKAYLNTLRAFNGDVIKLIVSKSKVDDITNDITQYKAGSVVDIKGSFKYPKLTESNYNEEGGEENSQGFVNNDIISFPESIVVKELQTPNIPVHIELDFDNMRFDKDIVKEYFGANTYEDVISKILGKFTTAENGKYLSIKYDGNCFTRTEKVDVSLDEVKKLGCSYTVR